MAKIYYRKIMAGEMTIEELPERWKEEVRALLDDEPSVN
jgi:Zn-dependent M32 family carboxypeptidase